MLVENIMTRDGKHLYLKRYVLFKTKWLRIYIHNFKYHDDDLYLHDHPFDCFKFILSGGYVEELPGGEFKYRQPGHNKILKGTQLHRIHCVFPHTWTLFIGFKHYRKWGFQTEDGWVESSEYLKERKK